jgi:Fe-S cluster biogenesis protein NfuA/nitrite reductase/ring-hydroxylating ferredoxin subunit
LAVAARTAEEELVARVQALTEQAEALADPSARETADALAGAIVQLYGEGLERIFAALEPEVRARLAEDGVVASLMLMHGLYPVPLEQRVQEALDSVRPYMESHGGDVDLLGVEDGIARLRMQGSCSGCGASQATLELAIERALEAEAPDLLGLDVEGVIAAPRRPEPAPDAEWVELGGLEGLERGRLVAAGRGLVVANVAGTLLAYRDRCAGCGGGLAGGELVGGKLACAHCGRRFDLPRAGRGVDEPALQLEPVPLLRNGGPVRVALPAEPPAAAGSAHCELCPVGIGEDHRHLLQIAERRIVCVCETCWSLHSGDPEYRPPGARSLVLDDFRMGDDLWSAFQVPVGLAFLLRSGVSKSVIAMYPSPAGATESELELTAWDALRAANPGLELEPDAETLIIDRTGTPHRYAIVPTDRAYRLVGMIKSRWEGITGGRGVDGAVAEFFAELRA